MANKTIEIAVKVNGLDTINGQVEDLKKKLEDIGDIEIITDEAGNKIKKITKNVDDLGKSAKKSTSSIKDIAAGFGLMKVGEAILGKLADLFMENETVARAMEIATRALSIIFKDLFGFFSDNIPKVINYFKEIFENPQQALKEFGKLIKENIQERVSSAIDLFGYLASSVKKVFSGDFAGAMEDAKKAGKEFVDVQTGINNTVDRSKEAIGKAVNAVVDYTSKVTKLAAAQVDSEKAAKIAAERAKGRVADLEAEAEQLRQLRDNTLLSVADRIKANDKLKDKLEELRTAKIASAQADLLVAKNAVALNNTTANQTALIAAQNAVKQVNADITGQLSEQEQNRSNLIKEQNTLIQTAIEGEARRAAELKEFNAQQIIDITDRLDSQREALIEAQRIEEEALTIQRNSYAEGTQERADADQAILDSRQKLNMALVTNEKDKNAQIQAENTQHNLAIAADDSLSFQTRLAALDAELAAINVKKFESEEAYTAAVKANSDARNKIKDEEAAATEDALTRGSAALSQAADLLGESTDAGKAAAIASTTMSTYQSAQAAYAGMVAAIPGPIGIAAGAVAAGISVAAGIANVKKILSVKTPKGSGGSAPAISKPLVPTVNTSGQANQQNTTANKVTEVAGTTQPTITVKAYVSETEITNSQNTVKKINESAKI